MCNLLYHVSKNQNGKHILLTLADDWFSDSCNLQHSVAQWNQGETRGQPTVSCQLEKGSITNNVSIKLQMFIKFQSPTCNPQTLDSC